MSSAQALAQGNITNAKLEPRAATQGLAREVASVAARGQAAWIGYRVPMVDGSRQICCSDGDGENAGRRCRLEGDGGITMARDEAPGPTRVTIEPPGELLVFARVEAGAVTRVRTFTPDCAIDAGGMPLVWLTGVGPDDSVAWLSTVIASSAGAGDRHDHLARPALAAIALTRAASVDRTLAGFVASDRPEWLRGGTAFWLGSARGAAGARLLARMVTQDPSDKVRDKAVFGLSVSLEPAALETLLETARTDSSTRVRGQALFWLAHKAGQRAAGAITDAIERDPDTEVKKKAVFALSQMPKDEGVPLLIQVARTNQNPAVRKQAMFWLGQSKDPRAVQFFEQILTAKE
ncbi:MAG: HEAT repeat domain-containing protein [Solirubrobacteraceae bacterium]